jgi:predicted transcriptional regulator
MARLTKEQWQDARKRWEGDTREGYAWLADELGISRPAVSKMASSQVWVKGKVTQVTHEEEKVTQKLRKKVTDKEAKTKKETNHKSTTSDVQLVTEKKDPWRPTKYKPEYDEQAREFCLMGATDATLAMHFEVDEATINRWKIAHPSFCKSLKEGKDVADSEVASALYKSAMGLHVSTEDKVISNGEGGQEVVTLEKQIDPSITAQIFWLKNRQSKNWKDKVEQELTVDMRLIPWDDLRLISEKAIAVAEEKHKNLIDGRAERLALNIEYTNDITN